MEATDIYLQVWTGLGFRAALYERCTTGLCLKTSQKMFYDRPAFRPRRVASPESSPILVLSAEGFGSL